MTHFRHQRRLPYPREAVFDLVADIESYPEFLPGWREARILERRNKVLVVEQSLGGLGLDFCFRTTARLQRPESIHIESRDRPFRYLDQHWRFKAVDEGSATIATLEADYAIGDLPLRFVLAGMFELGFKQTLQAFEQRAREMLG